MRKTHTPLSLLRHDRDDQARAVIFDDWIATQPLVVRSTLEWWLYQLVEFHGFSEVCAKSLLVSLVVYCGATPDVQDLFDQHGEYVRASFEWSAVAAAKAEA